MSASFADNSFLRCQKIVRVHCFTLALTEGAIIGAEEKDWPIGRSPVKRRSPGKCFICR